MYRINHAKTGILEVDIAIERYMGYLSVCGLPQGTYALAGGCFRCIFDKTRLKDLDVYVLGSKEEHKKVMGDIAGNKGHYSTMIFSNPFAKFEVANIKPDAFVGEDVVVGSDLKVDIQIISYLLDSNFSTRIPDKVSKSSSYADRGVSSLEEIFNSFDTTISKAGMEFTIDQDTIAVSEVQISQDFLVDVSLRKLRLNHETGILPQQLCSMKRFYKFITLGYTPDDAFFSTWNGRLKANPHLTEFEYDQ